MTTEQPLTCGFGTPWLDHVDPPVGTGRGCAACAAQTEAASQAFAAAVAAGTYDAEGYTPAERRAQAKRRRIA